MAKGDLLLGAKLPPGFPLAAFPDLSKRGFFFAPVVASVVDCLLTPTAMLIVFLVDIFLVK